MKKIAITIIVITFVFALASLSFATNEFKMKGKVTKINGNQITIKNDNNKETTFEGNANVIKVGDTILLKGEIFKMESLRTELTAQDIELLTKQCFIDRADVNVIPQLEEQTRSKLFSGIDKQDCKLLANFKASRAYYRRIKSGAIVRSPDGWTLDYLTDEEYKNYLNLIRKSPF